MYRCSEVVRLISSDEYLSASPLKRLGIRLHLAMCRNCTRYVRQLRALGAAVRAAGSTGSPSEVEGAKAQILQRFSQKS
jgi:hypothetical protein